MSGRQPSGTLSCELWGKILLLAASNAAYARPEFESQLFDDAAAIFKEYNRFHRMRLVCKQFSSLFTDQPGLSSVILLHKNFAPKSLPSLLRRMRSPGVSVQTVLSMCRSPQAEVALAALSSAAPTVTTVLAPQVSNCMVPVLSVFTSLTACSLQSSDGEALDLSPLEALHALCELHLQTGTFAKLHAAASLTRLCLSKAHVCCRQKCDCINTLRELRVCDCSSLTLFRAGLPACTALQVLECRGSAILPDLATTNSTSPLVNLQQCHHNCHDWLS